MAGTPFRQGPYGETPALAELGRLWHQALERAAARGQRPPTRADLARKSEVAESTISDWAAGKAPPRKAGEVDRVGGVLARWAGADPVPLRRWEELTEAGLAARSARRAPRPGIGEALELADPFALEVHRPAAADGADAAGLPALPPYVRRAHDGDLAAVVAAAAGGASRVAVLVGGSSTGKTRACWEAVTAPGVLAGWRLWHPAGPDWAGILAEGLPHAGPRTVVWLNEAQRYLSGTGGEKAAAALQALSADPARAPVLILGTLWPRRWAELTRYGDDSLALARALLDGTRIDVPETFAGRALDDVRLAARHDPRLAAAARARDGEVTQFLAGAPALLDAYRTAPPGARAVIEAAMDARRLGHGEALPHAFLEAAAPDYMTRREWDAAGDDWLEQALAWTARPCRGTAGPVTRIRPRPGPRKAGPAAAGPAYRLADYLDQHARLHRAGLLPPDGLWDAAAHADPHDQHALASAARSRGLYRHAAQIAKDAAAVGHSGAAVMLTDWLSAIAPQDLRPAGHAAAHASVTSADSVLSLLSALNRAGAGDQAEELGRRAAAGVALDDPASVADLLDMLHYTGERDPAGELARRAAAGVPVREPRGLARLLGALEGTGVPVGELARRAAGGVSVDDPGSVAELLSSMDEAAAAEDAMAMTLASYTEAGVPAGDHGAQDGAGIREHAAELARRAAAGVPVRKPRGLARLLGVLGEMGVPAGELARRAAGGVCADDPGDVAELLDALRSSGAGEQAPELARRAVAGAALDDPAGLARLLGVLGEMGAAELSAALARRIGATADSLLAEYPPHLPGMGNGADLLNALRASGAGEQAAELARRAVAGVSADDLDSVAELLGTLARAGAGEEAAGLARRAAAGASLNDPGSVASLLIAMCGAGAGEAAAELARRAAAGPVGHPYPAGPTHLLEVLGKMRAGEAAELARRAAAGASLNNPAAVGSLLAELCVAGAAEQARELACRAAAGASLNDPGSVARLLTELCKAGAGEQAAELARRAAPAVPADDPRSVAELLDALRVAGAGEQVSELARRAAVGASLEYPRGVAGLLAALGKAGAGEQAAMLLARLPAAALFGIYADARGDQYRFGRDPDGMPARQWGWDDLL